MRSGGRAGKCPVCGQTDTREVTRYTAFPTFLFPMPMGQAQKVARRNLVLHACKGCEHYYQPSIDMDLLETIYSDYYRNYPYDSDESMQVPYREPFNRIFKNVIGLNQFSTRLRLLEIGCSKPENLQPFAEMGFDCSGIDPSPLLNQGKPDQDATIFHGYYETTTLPQPFDVIVSRFNLEHIVDLQKVLGKMRDDLVPGGRVFVQVPNLAYYLSRQQPVFIAHEHVHYFSVKSLVQLFARFGFELIASDHKEQPSIVACFVKRQPKVEPGRFDCLPRFESYLSEISRRRSDLAEYLSSPERVVLYGCGLALFWVLGMMSDAATKQIILVDDNERFDGAYIPAYTIPVHHLSRVELTGRDTVLLTLNPIYHSRVLDRLRSLKRKLHVVSIQADGLHKIELGQM